MTKSRKTERKARRGVPFGRKAMAFALAVVLATPFMGAQPLGYAEVNAAADEAGEVALETPELVEAVQPEEDASAEVETFQPDGTVEPEAEEASEDIFEGEPVEDSIEEDGNQEGAEDSGEEPEGEGDDEEEPAPAWADGSVRTFEELKAALADEGIPVITLVAEDGQASASIVAAEPLVISREVVLDLNGGTLKAEGAAFNENESLITVEAGKLTLRDSSEGARELFTYKVTTSKVSGLGTKEDTEDRIAEVQGTGTIETALPISSLVFVNGGSLTIEGGTLSGQTGGPAIRARSAALVMTGGAIVGCGNSEQNGGAIRATGSTFTMTGGVMGNNQAKNGGSLNFFGNSTVTLGGNAVVANSEAKSNGGGLYIGDGDTAKTDRLIVEGNAVVAGCTAVNGGGIYGDKSSTFEVKGGLVANNTATGCAPESQDNASESEGGNATQGGGGIYYAGRKLSQHSMKMSGGAVVGNVAFDGGGGIYIYGNNWKPNGASAAEKAQLLRESASHLEMTGGIVAANSAGGYASRTGGSNGSEGGGIRVSGTGTIAGGYLTNNRDECTFDFGGGGLYVEQGAEVTMRNALVTNNSARSFGGGVAGCLHANMAAMTVDGAAIYDNKSLYGMNTATNTDMYNKLKAAYSQNSISGSGFKGQPGDLGEWRLQEITVARPLYNTDTKSGDKKLTLAALQKYTSDYFCGGDSIVQGVMMGGGAAKWEGYGASNAAKTTGVSYQLPNISDVKTASYVLGLKANPTAEGKALAEKQAQVFVTGNYSNTNGGGIGCNGSLGLGYVPKKTGELSVSKTVENNLLAENRSFEFVLELTNESGNALANETYGGITFDAQGTHTFTLRHGEEFFVTELPQGTKFTVYERRFTFPNSSAAYEVTAASKYGNITVEGGVATGQVEEGDDLSYSVGFTNTFKPVEDVALTLTKELRGYDPSTAKGEPLVSFNVKLYENKGAFEANRENPLYEELVVFDFSNASANVATEGGLAQSWSLKEYAFAGGVANKLQNDMYVVIEENTLGSMSPAGAPQVTVSPEMREQVTVSGNGSTTVEFELSNSNYLNEVTFSAGFTNTYGDRMITGVVNTRNGNTFSQS